MQLQFSSATKCDKRARGACGLVLWRQTRVKSLWIKSCSMNHVISLVSATCSSAARFLKKGHCFPSTVSTYKFLSGWQMFLFHLIWYSFWLLFVPDDGGWRLHLRSKKPDSSLTSNSEKRTYQILKISAGSVVYFTNFHYILYRLLEKLGIILFSKVFSYFIILNSISNLEVNWRWAFSEMRVAGIKPAEMWTKEVKIEWITPLIYTLTHRYMLKYVHLHCGQMIMRIMDISEYLLMDELNYYNRTNGIFCRY